MNEGARGRDKAPGRRRARRLWRGALWTCAGLLVLVAGLGLGGYLWLRQSLPQTEGTIEVAGPSAPVAVTRDRFGIPHIEAKTLLDAAFAQGFVHAQDRLWQMEFQRRLGAGRLAEVVGEAGLPTDRFMRTLGLYRRSEASLAHQEPATIAWLEAYAQGVNAYLATRSGPLPPEFLLLRQSAPEPWRPADSLVWIRLMALDLSGNYGDEILRAQLVARLSPEQIADLWPAYPEAAPITLAGLARALPFDDLARALPQVRGPRPGSNAWVAAGDRTATGAPLLANDPHLRLQAPGTFYLAHIETPELSLSGATLPGVPGVILGQNGSIAWGFTTTGSDTQDLFVERIDPDDPNRYLTPEGPMPFSVREEIIRVRDAGPIALTVRETRHGPVVSDLLPGLPAEVAGAGHVVALAWTGLALDDTSLQGVLKLGRARDWAGFVLALRDIVAPQQNILYADASGRIGIYVPGRVPIRGRGDGRWPVPGWSGSYDWQGLIPFEDLPHALDPPDGVLLNANNRVVPDDYPYFLTADWEPPLRARRIEELLVGDDLDLADFAAMQADQLSMMAQDLLPLMLEAEPAGGDASDARARLEAWDGIARAGAPEPLIFAGWYRELARLVYADELGPLFGALFRVRPAFMRRVLSTRRVWCDDVTTERREGCDDLLGRALGLARADLRARFGADPATWRWGEAHPAWMAHPLFEDVPVLSDLARIAVPTGGDGSTIDVGHYAIGDPLRPFANTHAASYRGLYDLADPARSRFVAATGQSGNPLSPHYRDLTELWRRGETVLMTPSPDDPAARTLILEPAR